MAFMNQFPYTNFHDVNLDWILKHLGDCQPMPVFWESTATVEEDPDNPGSYIITHVFLEASKYVDAWERGSRVTFRFTPTQYTQKYEIMWVGTGYSNPPTIFMADGSYVTIDPDLDNITVTVNVTP